MKQSQTSRSSRRGVAYVMALILLALCFSLAVAMASATNLNLRRSDNLHVAMDAQLAAESGLAFATLTMEGVQSDRYWDGNTPDIMPIIHTHLSARLNQTANISGQPLPDAVDTNGDGLDDLILTPTIRTGGFHLPDRGEPARRPIQPPDTIATEGNRHRRPGQPHRSGVV